MNNTNLELLKKTIDRSNEQGRIIADTVTGMILLETEMRKMHTDTNDKLTEMRDLYEDIKYEFEEYKKTIPLSGPEADKLQSLAHSKAYEFTKLYFGKEVSEELFSKKYGHLIRGVYTRIKKHFAVSKYNQVKHHEAKDAYEYVNTTDITDLGNHYLRLTNSQYETSVKNGDNLPEDFKGAHRNRLEFYEFEVTHQGR